MRTPNDNAFTALLALFLVMLQGCAPEQPKPVDAPPPDVTVQKPVSKNVQESYEYVGRTESPDFVEIHARVTGYLTKIYFDDGQEVDKDQLLFEIDRRPYEYALRSAEARLEQANAQLKLADLNLNRNRTLIVTNAVSQQDLDEAIQQQANAAAEIRSAQASIDQAKLDLDFCMIKAPIAGRISQANITVGNLISMNQLNAPPLTTIASMDPMHVSFDADELAVLRFREYRRRQGLDVDFKNVKELNQKVLVALSNETEFRHEGLLDFIDNQVRPSTGTLLVRASVPNSDRYFAPGFFVKVRIPFGDEQPSILIPERSILSDQSLQYVLVVGVDNVVNRRDVELGSTENRMRVVKNGIDPNDRVIVNGLQRARPGMKVNPTEELAEGSTSIEKKE
ncbi:Efflux pump periplasmic linker BepF [Pirellula sp. SH-Sr6A]|uniref:efflux RND transporter periplasmic adaptor subunit n=1 Tax=Pirellula sp. SH-Sr6A TaxID=1632865 RepID=UPI00078E24EA|nr:efflux RND transporter periplasmic adaptor subunit [Pirellula sp. SH-Sr6A]AMV32745.1 Efflux pump periplasmic linker BepF [Pirellula sp. SH-Sr6A]